ncbi:hypothetical protein B5F24_11705 [Bacteroides clarus]|uniref:Uncharacterized protein n=1 Tax=Bacteroides clarus TaxID=626929 RepID=A0A1Y4JLA7_9BACE|nr:hypothetical protein [Bacteroides clarus]OUP33278.1 hypothetical protein B5F24_11705 [Bacteroides clarus]
MKNIKSAIYAALMTIAVICIPGCSNEYDDVAPGSYVDTERIETFPGDTVSVAGTASNGSPISFVSLVCEAWGVNQVYDRTAYEDNVFDYEYQLIVPKDATFNQVLTVTVKCENGKSTVREIPISFLPDTSAPTVTPAFNAQVGVDFDTEQQKAVWDIDFTAMDDRRLKSVHISIPALSYDETVEVSDRSASVKKTVEFTTTGSYPCVITIEDASGNKSVNNIEVMVMLSETENPIQDYPGMYVVDANENPDDYIDGYYRWMDRKGEYQYEGKFYAATDNSKIFFTPERNLDGDLYGVSPYVSSKLMNNNGYAVPVTINKAGYYGIWIDLQAHTYSIWALEIPTDAYTGALCVTGEGFTIGNWALSAEMTKITDYRYTGTVSLVEGYGDYVYCLTSPDWSCQFHGDGKYWWIASGGANLTFHTDYSGEVIVTFDTAYPWGTIKKLN